MSDRKELQRQQSKHLQFQVWGSDHSYSNMGKDILTLNVQLKIEYSRQTAFKSIDSILVPNSCGQRKTYTCKVRFLPPDSTSVAGETGVIQTEVGGNVR